MAVTNFFPPAINEVPRNPRNGRPELMPRGMSTRVEYSRASSLADEISDSAFLYRWQMRYLARGMGMYTDLQELAAAEVYHTGLEPLDVPTKRRSGKQLDDIIERCLDRMKIHEKADYGTAFHALTEPGNTGVASERMQPDVDSYLQKVRLVGMEIVATETFTANDETMTAGTFDHLIRFPGEQSLLDGYLIQDKKTGRVDPHHWCIQLATYAHSDPYNVDDDSRPDWPGEINQNWGIMAHTPALGAATDFYAVDIRAGWEMALAAAQVRDFKARGDLLAPLTLSSLDQRFAQIPATDRDGLATLWCAANDAGDTALTAEIERKVTP